MLPLRLQDDLPMSRDYMATQAMWRGAAPTRQAGGSRGREGFASLCAMLPARRSFSGGGSSLAAVLRYALAAARATPHDTARRIEAFRQLPLFLRAAGPEESPSFPRFCDAG